MHVADPRSATFTTVLRNNTSYSAWEACFYTGKTKHGLGDPLFLFVHAIYFLSWILSKVYFYPLILTFKVNMLLLSDYTKCCSMSPVNTF